VLGTLLTVFTGLLVVLVITALTGYFVAQEFGFTSVDRSRLRAQAGSGDIGAQRALTITGRTSFMLSGAQLGITVTGLVVGYVAEPTIGVGLGELLGGTGVPLELGIAIGTAVALLFATVVQMVFGELFPKNLAIARPEPVARRLALSTAWYLSLFGWLIRIFDGASNLLLKAIRITPVHDIDQVATPRDLEAIIDESRDAGELPAELSAVLDRVLDFTEHTARAAMIPRPRVATVTTEQPVSELLDRMTSGHSRYPVVSTALDDVVGVVCLRDVLMLAADELDRPVGAIARPPVMVPDSLPLSGVLRRLRGSDEQLGCVLDEYGGFAGVITLEDLAEELLGEIGDEHDEPGTMSPAPGGGWTIPGSTHVDEVSRLVDRDLPPGDHQTIGGLVIARLGRLPGVGDTVTVVLPDAETGLPDRLAVTVRAVSRRVPDVVEVIWLDRGGQR
jgi:CBS domain containing-hemolysin-like protein